MPYDEGWVSKNRSIYQRVFVICFFWKYFCFWSICKLIHENSVGKNFLGCSYLSNGIKEYYIYIWYSFWAKVPAIPYRKLAQVEFEPTSSCLLCTRSNHWAIWLNDKAQVIAVINIIYTVFIYIIYIWFIYMYCIVLYIYMYCIVLYVYKISKLL